MTDACINLDDDPTHQETELAASEPSSAAAMNDLDNFNQSQWDLRQLLLAGFSAEHER